jgi:hypothetical protein
VRTKPLVTSHNHYKQPLSQEKVDNNEQNNKYPSKNNWQERFQQENERK